MSGRSRSGQDNEQVCTGRRRSGRSGWWWIDERDDLSRRATVVSVAEKTGCSAPTLYERVRKVEVNGGKRAGVPTEMAEKLRALERANRELRQANDSVRKASAYFARAEPDHPSRK